MWKTTKGFLMKDKFPFTEAFGAVNRAWESHHEDFFAGKQIVLGLLVLEVVLLPQPREPGWGGGWERLSRPGPQCLFPHDTTVSRPLGLLMSPGFETLANSETHFHFLLCCFFFFANLKV